MTRFLHIVKHPQLYPSCCLYSNKCKIILLVCAYCVSFTCQWTLGLFSYFDSEAIMNWSCRYPLQNPSFNGFWSITNRIAVSFERQRHHHRSIAFVWRSSIAFSSSAASMNVIVNSRQGLLSPTALQIFVTICLLANNSLTGYEHLVAFTSFS